MTGFYTYPEHTPVWAGRAMAGLLAMFAEFERQLLRARVKASIAQARRHGKRHGRPPRIARYAGDVRRLYATGLSQSASARQFGHQQNLSTTVHQCHAGLTAVNASEAKRAPDRLLPVH
jgi:hypothetical protein